MSFLLGWGGGKGIELVAFLNVAGPSCEPGRPCAQLWWQAVPCSTQPMGPQAAAMAGPRACSARLPAAWQRHKEDMRRAVWGHHRAPLEHGTGSNSSRRRDSGSAPPAPRLLASCALRGMGSARRPSRCGSCCCAAQEGEGPESKSSLKWFTLRVLLACAAALCASLGSSRQRNCSREWCQAGQDGKGRSFPCLPNKIK